MGADKICELLEKKAIREEKVRLDSASTAYNRAIGLTGTSEVILLSDRDGKEIRMYTSDIYKAITDALLKNRDKKLKDNAVTKFLAQVEDFQANMESLNEYIVGQ